MERGVWGERGRQMDGRGSRIWSNLSTFSVFSTVFCLSFLPWFLVCIFVPFGCHMDAKEVQKRPQGHPFGQQKLTKLALDHGCENMAPVQ